MNYTELIQVYFDRSNALQSYWTLYVVVIGGLLAFSSMRKQPDRLTTIVVTILYCFFAYKNLGAIHDVLMQQHGILEAMKQAPAAGTTGSTVLSSLVVEPTLVVPDYPGVRNFHYACDVLVVIALWVMERRRERVVGSTVPVRTE